MEQLPCNLNEYIKLHLRKKRRDSGLLAVNDLSQDLLIVKCFMYQIFRSLAYLHSKHICHRDIKPDNMLIDLASGVLKICDFGK